MQIQVALLSELVVGSEKWSSYILECKVKFIETFAGGMTWAGVVARYHDTGNTYVFAIDLARQHADVDIEVAGTTKKILRVPFAAEKDKWYKLKVTVDGNHFQLFVDDILIQDFKDDSFSPGKVGVIVIRSHVHFDDLTVTGKRIDKIIGVIKKVKDLATTWGRIRKL